MHGSNWLDSFLFHTGKFQVKKKKKLGRILQIGVSIAVALAVTLKREVSDIVV